MIYERPGSYPATTYCTPEPRRKTWATPSMERFNFLRLCDEALLAVALDYTAFPVERAMAAEVLVRRTAAGVTA